MEPDQTLQKSLCPDLLMTNELESGSGDEKGSNVAADYYEWVGIFISSFLEPTPFPYR